MTAAGTWSGGFVFGEAWAAYEGPAADNSPHAHLAVQLALTRDDEIVVDLPDRQVRGSAVLIRPMVSHQLGACTSVLLVYIQANAPLALDLLDRVGANPVETLPSDLANTLLAATDLTSVLKRLMSLAPPSRLDPRVASAMTWLEADPSAHPIAQAASAVGLSEAHLRALARSQLGFPLSTWMVWRKLERASRELASGSSLAEAAAAAGFADQAHCTRTMRRMFGVTLGVAKGALG